FGIAKVIPDDGCDAGTRTQLCAPALTPEYASPEQIAGKPVSTASDIYSLGVLLFELLTGERPHRLDRSSRAALEEAIVNLEPQRPSAIVRGAGAAAARGTTVRRLSRVLRGARDTFARRALRKIPREGYATADALSRDIEHYLRCRPVSARADGTWYRLSRFIGRHRLPVAAVSGSALAFVATLVVTLSQPDPALAVSARNVVQAASCLELVAAATPAPALSPAPDRALSP